MTWTNQLHYHPGPQADLVLALPNMYPMQYLLEFLKGLVMWNNTGRISMTWGGFGISERSFGEDPVIMVYQKPEALNQTSDSLQ